MRPSGIFCLKVDRVAVLQNNLQSVDDSHRCASLKNRMCRKGGVIGVSHRLGFLNLAYTGACTDIPADGDVSMLNSSPDEVQ